MKQNFNWFIITITYHIEGSNRMYALGIDGGGTKTIGVIADQEGRIIAKHTVGATNPNSMQQSVVEQELIELFVVLKKQASFIFSQLSVVFAGMSGVDRDDDRVLMKKMLQRTLSSVEPTQSEIIPKIIVDNDAINALYSGTLGLPGIVNIAGTGSITYGVNEKGERARVGGWGYLIGDPGSGYAIGKAGLQAIFNAYDGCADQTSLTGLILEHFSVSVPTDLIQKIYEPGKARKTVAPLSQLVVKAADEGDNVAKQILLSSGEDMARAINCMFAKLFSKRIEQHTIELGEMNGIKDQKGSQSKALLVLTGGVYKRSDWFVPTIEDELLKRGSRLEIILPQVPPVAGALIAALKSENIELEGRFIPQLIEDGLANE
jgi:N-acetylglucosamine kinase-like BadF-type ATPase